MRKLRDSLKMYLLCIHLIEKKQYSRENVISKGMDAPLRFREFNMNRT